jgi:hypothetical protein
MGDHPPSSGECQAERVAHSQKQGSTPDSLMPSIDDYQSHN